MPRIIVSQLDIFLSLENKKRITTVSSISHIVINIVLYHVFVNVLHMQEYGLALAYSLEMWIIAIFKLLQFASDRTILKFQFTDINWKELGNIIKNGFPLAAGYLYQTIRSFVLNFILEKQIGSVAISAYLTANNIIGFFWTIPNAMIAVSQLLISISVGEEDKNTLVTIMKNMFRYYLTFMIGVDILVVIFAGNLTSLYFSDTASQVFKLSRDCLRIIPFCMPLSIICMHFTAYGQTMNKQWYINILAFLDGIFGVLAVSFLLVGSLGFNGISLAIVINGFITLAFIILYAWFSNSNYPDTIEKLMVIPDDFGVSNDECISISINNLEEVSSLSKKIQSFCLEKGIDQKRAYLAALAMEEMAGNVVEHGFTKDDKKHSVDIRVAHKNDEIILRIRDDCVNFDPSQRIKTENSSDVTKTSASG